MGGEGPCEDCGGVIHTGEEFLFAACHRTSDRWKHLGPDLRGNAIAWVKECRAAGAGLPIAVVKSFVPSEACLCPSGDCFYSSLITFRKEGHQHSCIPCGANKSSCWRTGGERARQYQLYFTGEGVYVPTVACGRRKRGLLRQAIFATRVIWRSIASRTRQQDFQLKNNCWQRRMVSSFLKASLGLASPSRATCTKYWRQATWCAARTLRRRLLESGVTMK